MSVYFTDEELVERVSQSRAVFAAFGMAKAANFVHFIVDELQRNEIIRSYLNISFKNLQQIAEKDFGKTEYRKRIVNYLFKNVRLAMTLNIDQVAAANANPAILDGTYDRMNANKIMKVLNKILIKGSETPYEKLLGLSYAYASTVEGVYKKAIQDCYLWERLGRSVGEYDAVESVYRLDVPKVIGEFNDRGIDTAIFDRYNSTIRNAIAHSTIYFDASSKKMIYKDKRSGKEKSCDVNELYDMYQKLWSVYLMVLLKNQILIISDACSIFLERKSSRRYP